MWGATAWQMRAATRTVAQPELHQDEQCRQWRSDLPRWRRGCRQCKQCKQRLQMPADPVPWSTIAIVRDCCSYHVQTVLPLLRNILGDDAGAKTMKELDSEKRAEAVQAVMDACK